ncbi:MAG: hypothetical protein QME81_16975 [bacterium]|nr:hypothetical protein [bacterium]
MTAQEKKEYQTVILAALLHNVGEIMVEILFLKWYNIGTAKVRVIAVAKVQRNQGGRISPEIFASKLAKICCSKEGRKWLEEKRSVGMSLSGRLEKKGGKMGILPGS